MKPEPAQEQFSPQGLPICPTCFWTVLYMHECDVAAGKLAKKLIADLAPVPGTMYGWGEHKVAFTAGDATVVFDVSQGRLNFDSVSLFGKTTTEKAGKVVRALVEALR